MTSSILRALHVYSSHTMELQRECIAPSRLRAVVKPFASMSDSLSRCCFCIVPISLPYSRTVWPSNTRYGCSENVRGEHAHGSQQRGLATLGFTQTALSLTPRVLPDVTRRSSSPVCWFLGFTVQRCFTVQKNITMPHNVRRTVV